MSERADAGEIASLDARAEAEAYEPPLTDWTLRPFAAGAPPLAVAAALAVGLVAVSQLARAALLAALALGSWLGGVVMERAVDWLFD